MEPLDQESVTLPTGQVLKLTYSHQLPNGQLQGGPILDWVCNMCKATNFARFADFILRPTALHAPGNGWSICRRLLISNQSSGM